ncbi:MAG: FtsX-like permease family protein [Bacteroidetes bacterium]|nr:MAG: FtsX-like permease family protein [Bacteroidota bacterium]
MLYNYLKIAFRNLYKRKFVSLLNIAGLALGMSACLTMILIIRDQLGYDTFHPNAAQTYRIVCRQPDGMGVATVPYPLGDALQQEFPAIAAKTRLVRSIWGTDATTAANVTLPVDGFFAESSFFEVFGFKLNSDNPAAALSEPNTLVLSQQTAERFFGKNNPIGETLTLKNKGTYRITGVVETPPGKTHLEFDVLASVSTLATLEKAYPPEEEVEKVTDNWGNWYMAYVYVTLQPGKTREDLTKALLAVSSSRKNAEKTDKDLTYVAQSLGSLSPRAERLANDTGRAAPWFLIWGLLAFVVILTLFPCLNYANMAISLSLSRIREMGIRKAMGAGVRDVKNLMRAEAIVTSLLALVLAYPLHLIINGFVAESFPPEVQMTGLKAGPLDWLIFVVFGLLVGLLAGWIPARRMARLHPALALRGNKSGEQPGTRRLGWRKMMLVGQFVVSLVLMIVVATLWTQMRFMTVADYGFQKENLLTVELQGNKAELMAAELSRDPHVSGVCATSVQIAGSNLQGFTLQKGPGTEPLSIHGAIVNDQYIPVMGLELVAGENFPAQIPSTEQFLIINEKALDMLGIGSAQEAIGQTLWLSDSLPVTIRGVLRDFHYRIMEHGIEPFALRYSDFQFGLLHVRIAPGDPVQTFSALDQIWRRLDKVHPLKATFMEQSMREAYGDVILTGQMAGFFAILAIVLACMGLLGMVTYSVGSKVKEIGIRKVLGASAAQITLSLSRSFLTMLLIAVLLAVPLGYLLSLQFLQLFAYRIEVGWMIPAMCVAALLGLALLTVGVQTVHAALANPVKTLRSE